MFLRGVKYILLLHKSPLQQQKYGLCVTVWFPTVLNLLSEAVHFDKVQLSIEPSTGSFELQQP